MDDLLKDAIADAKAVRETALANAKIALEEAFTPRLQSMLSKKIQSEMEDSDEEMDAEEMRDSDEEMDKDEAEHEEMRNSDEIEHEEEMDAEEMRDSEEMRDADEAEHEEMRDSEEEMEEEMKDKDEEDAEEMRETEDAEEEDAEEEDKMDEAEHEEEMEEDELDLESVLAELEKDLDDEDKVDEEMKDKDEEDKVDEAEDKEEEDKVDENDVSSEIGKADNKLAPAAGDSSKVGQGPEGEGSDKKAGTELGDHEVVDDLTEVEDKDEEDLDLDEVLRALTEEDKEEEDAEENEKLKAEIKEHRKVIHFMRSKLNEVNLLNAKLLFSNKLFRAFGLNNNQKLKVVETFDRTKNLREVKLVYATLAESFKRPGRLSESVKKGSASKPVRSTKPKAVLSEGAQLKARFKKLANIL